MAMGITRVAEQYGHLAESQAHREALASYAEEAAALVPRNAGVGLTAGLNDPRRMQLQAAAGDRWEDYGRMGDDEASRYQHREADEGDPSADAEYGDYLRHQKRSSVQREANGVAPKWVDDDAYDRSHPENSIHNRYTDIGNQPEDARRDYFEKADESRHRNAMQRQADMPVPRGTDPLFTERQEGGPHGDIYKGDGDWFSDYGMEPDADDRARWQDATRQRDQAINDYIQNTGLDPYVPEWQAREEKAQREGAFRPGDHVGGTTLEDMANDWGMPAHELAALSDFKGDVATPMDESQQRFLYDYMKNRHKTGGYGAPGFEQGLAPEPVEHHDRQSGRDEDWDDGFGGWQTNMDDGTWSSDQDDEPHHRHEDLGFSGDDIDRLKARW